ncbi:MAG TPA: glycosyltransferase [Bacilli bacterium]|nr:glycosyltransferase [Bacilli bacterium]
MLLERTNTATDLAKIYTAADLFVNMTYEDTYPTVNLEACACGTPVATYQTSGSV